MSRSRRRRSHRKRRASATLGPIDVVWVLAFALASALLGGKVAGRFIMPIPIDRDLWHVVSPGLDEAIQDPKNGRGVYIEDGALALRQHAFHRAEILSPRDTQAVQQVQIDVEQGVVRLNWPGPSGISYAVLGPDTAQLGLNGQEVYYRPEGQPWISEVAGQQVVLKTTNGPLSMGPSTGGSIELTAISEEVRVARLTVSNRDGTAILDEDYAQRSTPLFHWIGGALLGGLLGAACRTATRRRSAVAATVETVLLVALPLLVCTVAPATWLYTVERAYLVRTPAWGLARIALGLSVVPAVGLALLRSGVLVPPEVQRRMDGRPIWVGLSVMASVGAAIQGGPTLTTAVVTIVGLGFLLLPLRIAHAAEQPSIGAMLVDAPAAIAVLSFGWGWGLLVAIGWRFLTVSASAGSGVLRKAPRPTTDLLFAMLLLTPVSLELGVRDSYLEEGWDLTRLSGDLAPSVGWQDPKPAWSHTCGDPSGTVLRVLWMGGSSTGGAYQFRDQPTAFYPAQAHARLCALLPDGVALHSENYGDGGRDTFTISRSLEDLAARAPLSLVVVYTGVNDLLTMSGTKTRAQREAERAERDATTTGLASLGAQSRLLTGIGLYLRPLHATGGARVPEVPLADAEDNFASIAATAEQHRSKVLLLTEVIRQDRSDPLAPYAALESQMAAKLDRVRFYDLASALKQQGPWDDQTMLVDQNHLSRAGSARVGAALVPALADILELPAPQSVDTTPIAPAAFQALRVPSSLP